MNRRIREARQREGGFTLIELLIVIVILGVLAAIVVFSVAGITDRGEASAEAANVETVNIASEAFRATHANGGAASADGFDDNGNGYADTLIDLRDAGFLKTIPGTLAPDNLSFTVTPAGGGSYTVDYDPGTGEATGSPITGGGGGGTTTTTTAPPTLSINVTSPAAGPVSGTVNLVASGTLVTSVQFQVDGVNVGAVDNSAPFEATWDTTTATNGAHNITAIANGTLTSAPVAVTVNNAAPVTIAIATPSAGNVNGTVNLTATVTGSVTSVEYFYGSTSIGIATTSPYTVAWNTTLLANGPYVLTAVADGTVTSAPVNVAVNNACAYVSHTAPATLDIDMSGSGQGELNAPATFSFQTTGPCTAPMSIRINRPGGGTVTVTMPGASSTGPATWSFTIPDNNGGWDDFDDTIGTGTFTFRSNGVQIPGSPTPNINFGSTDANCTYVSMTGSPLNGSDILIDWTSGSGNPLGTALSFTVQTVGNCSTAVRIILDPPGSGNGKDLSLTAAAASYSGGPRTWTRSFAVGDTTSGGWGSSDNSDEDALLVHGTGGGTTALSNAPGGGGVVPGIIDYD